MIKIIMSGVFGWEIMPFMIRDQLNESKGGDIEFDLSSPGGSVFEGIEIFNMVRDHKRENPKSQMILNIKAEAASMGSYFASNPAFDLVTVEDNASWMIHNPLMGVIGDHNEMRKATDFLDGLAKMMAPSYANRSGQTVEETRTMMDNETWLFGDEIVKAGFADEVMKTNSKKSRAESKSMATMNFNEAMDRVKKREITKDEFSRVAAIVKDCELKDGSFITPNGEKKFFKIADKPALGGENKNQEDITVKNGTELKEKFPDVHAEVEMKGKEAGIKQEKESEKVRLETLIAMKSHDDFKNIPEALERIDKGIAGFETVSQVELGLMSVLRSPAVKAVMDSNEVPDINTVDPAATASGEQGKPVNENKGAF